MPRAVAIYRELKCHTCDWQWHQHVWGYDEDWSGPRESLTCRNPSGCDLPHIEVLPRWDHRGGIAQCRREQRSAVYLMPDGTVSCPPSNAYDDIVAVDAVHKGGVRMEFPSVRAMVEFQRNRRRIDSLTGEIDANDEFTDRCLTIDYDQQTLRSGGTTFIHDALRAEDEARERVYERQRRGQVFYGGEEYERRVEEIRRRKGH